MTKNDCSILDAIEDLRTEIRRAHVVDGWILSNFPLKEVSQLWMYDYEFHLQVFCQFLTFLAAGNHSGIWSTVRALQKFAKRVVFDKFGPGF